MRNYPCTDCNLLFLQSRFWDFEHAGIDVTEAKALCSAAVNRDIGLVDYSPGGTVDYPDDATEAACVERLNAFWSAFQGLLEQARTLDGDEPEHAWLRIYASLDNPAESVLDSSQPDDMQFVCFSDIRHQLPREDFEDSLDGIENHDQLRILSLYANDLETVELAQRSIELLEHLVALDLSGNRLRHLPPLPPSLRYLDVSGNPLATLEGLPEGLQYLNLRKTRVDAEAVDRIRRPGLTIWT